MKFLRNMYNERYENQLILMAENKIKTGKYKIFDKDARVIKREKFPELVAAGKTSDENCLVIINRDGETLVITCEFEHVLYNALKNRF